MLIFYQNAEIYYIKFNCSIYNENGEDDLLTKMPDYVMNNSIVMEVKLSNQKHILFICIDAKTTII